MYYFIKLCIILSNKNSNKIKKYINTIYLDFYYYLIYNFYMQNSRKSSQLLLSEIALILSNLGLSENYHSFHFLTDIIFYMIKHDDTTLTYKKSLQLVAEKYEVSERSIINGLSTILRSCDDIIKSKMQYNLSTKSILNKIRVIKKYVIEKLA